MLFFGHVWPLRRVPTPEVAYGARFALVDGAAAGLTRLVTCRRCGRDGRVGARFCESCGSALELGCTTCGAAARPGARFCDECGSPLESGVPAAAPSAAARRPYTPPHLAERILTQRSALEGERKQVTVLFADVKGSMELAGQVDPEEWHEILDRFFAILAAGVHRCEGTVNQYTGDGIMALFGAPLALEDHAQRACAAALALADELATYARQLKRERSLGFAVRMGLHSGEVVVGRIGDDLRLDYTAQGHVVGLAARMQELCDPGRVYLTGATAALVGDLFEREDLGDFQVRGVPEPIRVFALKGMGRLRTRFDVSRQRGLSRFVGREAELGALEREVHAARAGGRALGLSAEAGVGKSRLLHELESRCRARGLAVHRAQCLAHGAAPLLPVVELLRGLMGIDARDDEDAARRKVAGTLLLLDEGFRDALPAVFELLGITAEGGAAPGAAENRRERLLAVVRAALRRGGSPTPSVLMVEDLHWADEPSLDYLRRLVRDASDLPVLLLFNYRPSFAGPTVLGCEEIALHPLSDEASAELVRELLGGDPSAALLAERITARASGNPFFAEEIVRSLAETGALAGARGHYRATPGAEEPTLPATVQALLAARIDRLDERDKWVLQTAAVIGKRFSRRLVAAVAGLADDELDASLAALERVELVFAEARRPELELAFEHPLTQEVAYGSLLRERRRRLHAAIAHALARIHGDRTGEPTARIAHHFEEAGDALQAARWGRRAAQWLAGTHAKEALRLLHRGLELLESQSVEEEGARIDLDIREALFRLAPFADPVSGLSHDQAERLVASGRAIAEHAGLRAPLTSLLSTYAYFLSLKGYQDEADHVSREVAALSHQLTDRALAWRLDLDAAQNAFWAGRLREATALIDRVYAALEAGELVQTGFIVGLDGRGFVLALRGLCRSLTGRREDGRADLEEALASARLQGSPEALGVAHVFRAFGAVVGGELTAAAAAARAALDVAAKLEHTFLQPMALLLLAMVDLGRGHPDEARRTLEHVRESFLGGDRDALFDAFALVALAQALLDLGERERATATVELALATATRTRAQIPLLFAHLVAGRLAITTGDRCAGRTDAEHVDEAARLIEESGTRSFLPRLHLARAGLAAARGDATLAARESDEARRLATEMGGSGPALG
jgi:class 3 adenylate cyclase